MNAFGKKRPLGSDVSTVRLKFRELEMKEIEEKEDDVYSPNYVPKKYAKNSAEYGRPKPGTLTEMRAQKAGLVASILALLKQKEV